MNNHLGELLDLNFLMVTVFIFDGVTVQTTIRNRKTVEKIIQDHKTVNRIQNSQKEELFMSKLSNP